MALNPSSTYAGQVSTSDPAYPYGKAQNEAVEGDGTGTPLEASWVSDVWGFLQAMLSRGGVTPSGVPDKVGTSDYLDALIKAPYTWLGQHLFSQDVKLAANRDVLYLTVPSRKLQVDLSKGHSLDSSGTTLQPTGYEFSAPSKYIVFPIDVPGGGIIENVRCGMRQGATPTADFMSFFIRRTVPITSGSGGAPSVTDSSHISCTSVGEQIKGVALSAAVQNDTSRLQVIVQSSDVADSAAKDILRFIEVTVTDPYASGHR